MNVAIGFDHAGYPLRAAVIEAAREAGAEALDLGTNSADPVDFPRFAEKVGRALQRGEAERGVLVCGSGIGACIAANKVPGVRAGICHDTYSAHQGVEHDDMNVLCLGARIIGVEPACEIITSFLNARFVGNDARQSRHKRRVEKVRKLEMGKSNY